MPLFQVGGQRSIAVGQELWLPVAQPTTRSDASITALLNPGIVTASPPWMACLRHSPCGDGLIPPTPPGETGTASRDGLTTHRGWRDLTRSADVRGSFWLRLTDIPAAHPIARLILPLELTHLLAARTVRVGSPVLRCYCIYLHLSSGMEKARPSVGTVGRGCQCHGEKARRRFRHLTTPFAHLTVQFTRYQ
jgi:hypothetical protein